ncbi:sugar transferase [Microbacterium sp. RD1]|uniref:sugar transferase n=1 Tax=Microbacterium sp. RD1 TaxID=3457313 RepID=UPI003FA573A2
MNFGRLLSFDFLKRLIDVFASALGLVALAPVMAVLALLVAANLGRPVIFRQERPGLHGRIFTLCKFRSMRRPDERRGLVTDEQRLTRFGRLLRSTSLDELPTLWNVLKGDMSLVGPRPLLVEYLAQYTPEQARRHEVRPGVTGLAQVSGRNSLTWEDKFRIDVEYVERRSFSLDFQILARTMSAVIARRGISHEGHVTMTKFGGSDG